MKKFALMITAIATGLAMTSCLDSDDNKVTNTVTRSYAKCFNTVYDATTGDILDWECDQMDDDDWDDD